MILPIPPIVGQLAAKLPDGALDPDSTTDCGEACVASVVDIMRKLPLSPGCIRQAMSLPYGTGVTTSLDITEIFAKLDIHAEYTQLGPEQLVRSLSQLRHYGRYMLLLGSWLAPDVGHWVLAYQGEGKGVWCMEPWTATYKRYSFLDTRRLTWDRQVAVIG